MPVITGHKSSRGQNQRISCEDILNEPPTVSQTPGRSSQEFLICRDNNGFAPSKPVSTKVRQPKELKTHYNLKKKRSLKKKLFHKLKLLKAKTNKTPAFGACEPTGSEHHIIGDSFVYECCPNEETTSEKKTNARVLDSTLVSSFGHTKAEPTHELSPDAGWPVEARAFNQVRSLMKYFVFENIDKPPFYNVRPQVSDAAKRKTTTADCDEHSNEEHVDESMMLTLLTQEVGGLAKALYRVWVYAKTCYSRFKSFVKDLFTSSRSTDADLHKDIQSHSDAVLEENGATKVSCVGKDIVLLLSFEDCPDIDESRGSISALLATTKSIEDVGDQHQGSESFVVYYSEVQRFCNDEDTIDVPYVQEPPVQMATLSTPILAGFEAACDTPEMVYLDTEADFFTEDCMISVLEIEERIASEDNLIIDFAATAEFAAIGAVVADANAEARVADAEEPIQCAGQSAHFCADYAGSIISRDDCAVWNVAGTERNVASPPADSDFAATETVHKKSEEEIDITPLVNQQANKAICEQVIEESTEQITEQIIHQVTEEVNEQVNEEFIATICEQFIEHVTERVIQVNNPISEHLNEPIDDQLNDQVSRPISEHFHEPISEPECKSACEAVFKPVAESESIVTDVFGKKDTESDVAHFDDIETNVADSYVIETAAIEINGTEANASEDRVVEGNVTVAIDIESKNHAAKKIGSSVFYHKENLEALKIIAELIGINTQSSGNTIAPEITSKTIDSKESELQLNEATEDVEALRFICALIGVSNLEVQTSNASIPKEEKPNDAEPCDDETREDAEALRIIAGMIGVKISKEPVGPLFANSGEAGLQVVAPGLDLNGCDLHEPVALEIRKPKLSALISTVPTEAVRPFIVSLVLGKDIDEIGQDKAAKGVEEVKEFKEIEEIEQIEEVKKVEEVKAVEVVKAVEEGKELEGIKQLEETSGSKDSLAATSQEPSNLSYHTYNPCTKMPKAWVDYDSDSEDAFYEEFFASFGKSYPYRKKPKEASKDSTVEKLDNHCLVDICTASSSLSLDMLLDKSGGMISSTNGWKKISLNDLFASVTPISAPTTDSPSKECHDSPFVDVTDDAESTARYEVLFKPVDDTADVKEDELDVPIAEETTIHAAISSIDEKVTKAIAETELMTEPNAVAETESNFEDSCEADNGYFDAGGLQAKASDDTGDEAEDIAEKCRRELFVNTQSWMKTELLLLEFNVDPTAGAVGAAAPESLSKTVKFADIQSDVSSEAGTIESCENASEGGSDLAQIDEINNPVVALILKEKINKYRKDFLHLIKTLVQPCDDQIKVLITDILSIRKLEGELFSLGSGINNEIAIICETMDTHSSLWRDKVNACGDALAELDAKFTQAKDNIGRLEVGFAMKLKNITGNITEISVLREQILENYNLFFELNTSQRRFGSHDIHTYTRVRQFELSTIWHYHVEIDEFEELLDDDIQTLVTSNGSVGAMIALIHESYAHVRKAMDLDTLATTRINLPGTATNTDTASKTFTGAAVHSENSSTDAPILDQKDNKPTDRTHGPIASKKCKKKKKRGKASGNRKSSKKRAR